MTFGRWTLKGGFRTANGKRVDLFVNQVVRTSKWRSLSELNLLRGDRFYALGFIRFAQQAELGKNFVNRLGFQTAVDVV